MEIPLPFAGTSSGAKKKTNNQPNHPRAEVVCFKQAKGIRYQGGRTGVCVCVCVCILIYIYNIFIFFIPGNQTPLNKNAGDPFG